MTTFTISEVLELASIASVDAQSDRIALYTLFGVFPGSSPEAVRAFKTKDAKGKQSKNHHEIVAAIKANAIPAKLADKLISVLEGKTVAVSGYYADRVEKLIVAAENAETGFLAIPDPATQQAIAFVNAAPSVDSPVQAGQSPSYTTWEFLGFHPCLDDFCANATPAQIGAATRDIKATIFAIADRRNVNTAALAACLANKTEGRIAIPVAFKALVDAALGQYLADKGYTTVTDVLKQYSIDNGITFVQACSRYMVIFDFKSVDAANFSSQLLDICTDPDALVAALGSLGSLIS